MNIRPAIRLALVPAAAALVTASCARQPAQPKATPPAAPAPRVAQRAPTTAPSAEYPVIVRLVGRDKEVTIVAGPDGPLYSASTKDGQVLVTHATLEQLRENHPRLYRFVHPAIVTDASVDAPKGLPMLMADHAGR